MIMKRIFPLGLILLGSLLIISAVAWAYLDVRVSKAATGPLPESIAGLQLVKSTSGAEAIAEFTDLHGKEFPVNTGAIGVYGNNQITLWVAGAPSEAIAVEMTNAMDAKIAEGNSPFTLLNKIRDRNRKIYALDGMGQKHYYFQSQNMVIWLAADPAISNEALQQILEVYP